jgi:hypothetical protein
LFLDISAIDQDGDNPDMPTSVDEPSIAFFILLSAILLIYRKKTLNNRASELT